jgi:hypothetical protein
MFDVGPVLVRPRLDIEELFDDNITYAAKNEKSDFITSVNPGIGLSLGQPEWNNVIVNLSLPDRIYTQNPNSDYIGQNFALEGVYQGSNFTIKAHELYVNTYGYLGGATFGQINPLWFQNFQDSLEFGYDIGGKTTLYLKTAYNAAEFERSILSLVDYEDFRGTFGASYHYTSQTSFFLEGYTGEVVTQRESIAPGLALPRAQYYGVFGGVQGSLGSRFEWYAKGGYEIRDYSNDTSAPGAVVAELDLKYHLNDATRFDLKYVRANQASINYAGVNYVYDQVFAAVDYKFGKREKLEAVGSVSYSDFSYQGVGYNGRVDSPITLTADLKYHFNRWLTGDIGYQFINFSSTGANVLSYEVQRTFVMLSIGYDQLPENQHDYSK